MGNRGWNAGGYAYMQWITCTLCGRKFVSGQRNPRRVCANKTTCAKRRKRKETGHA